jgi:hypothetical protein
MKLKNLKYITILVLILGGLFYHIYQPDYLLQFIEWRFFSESEVQGGMSRIYEMLAGINNIAEYLPLSLIGCGLGSTEVTSFFSSFFPTYASITPRVHNTYFSVLVENGILGFMLFIFILYKNFKILFRLKNKYPEFFALFIASLINSLFIWNLYFLPFYVIVFYIPILLSKKELKKDANFYP